MMIVVSLFAGIGALAALSALVLGAYAALVSWQMRRDARRRSQDWRAWKFKETRKRYGKKHHPFR